MALIKVPVEPYWVNAVQWYVENCMGICTEENQKKELAKYDAWMSEQGAHIIRIGDYYPWLHFTDPVAATMFMLRWA
jgi:hypothetical protein